MSSVDKKQLHFEINSLKRSLEFMKEENVHHKNRISEILNDRFDKFLLEEVDNFQTHFTREDHLFILLRNEIMEMDSIISNEINHHHFNKTKVNTRMKRLNKNMHIAEKQFGKLKIEFHRFLSRYII